MDVLFQIVNFVGGFFYVAIIALAIVGFCVGAVMVIINLLRVAIDVLNQFEIETKYIKAICLFGEKILYRADDFDDSTSAAYNAYRDRLMKHNVNWKRDGF